MKVTVNVELSGAHAITHRAFDYENENAENVVAWIAGIIKSATSVGHKVVGVEWGL